MDIMVILFALSVLAVFHAYIGYPVSLAALGAFRRRGVVKKPITPDVTLIITAYNEEQRIKEKLDNTLALDYPKDKLEVIVASDGSTDKTNEIVRDYERYAIRLLSVDPRGGKENAQKKAIEKAGGEIVVFSDVATRIDTNGLREIVANFADPSVGCVSSEDRLITKNGTTSGEGFYVRYEMVLRNLETEANSLVGLSGSFFAARKEVFYDFSGQMQSDFRTLLNSIKIGLRGVSDPRAVGYYLDVGDSSREFERKVRTVVRGLTVFFHHLEFINLFKYKLFAYQYCCHKLLRWLVPLFLIAAFLSNMMIVGRHLFFFVLFALQCAFYFAALAGFLRPKTMGRTWIKIPFYFINVNMSIAIAWLKFLTGHRIAMWQPSKR